MLIAVTGMHREARLFPGGGERVVSGGTNAGLAEKIEAAIARGGRAVISAGICGGLRPGLPIGTVVLGTEIVTAEAHYPTDDAWRDAMARRIAGAMQDAIAGSDTILTKPGGKAALYRQTVAAAVDMESHIAARVAAEHGLPFAALRVISDGAEHALPPAVLQAIDADGKLQLGRVLRSIAGNPIQIPDLIRAGRNSDAAMKRLLGCLDLLGIGFGCPHLG